MKKIMIVISMILIFVLFPFNNLRLLDGIILKQIFNLLGKEIGIKVNAKFIDLPMILFPFKDINIYVYSADIFGNQFKLNFTKDCSCYLIFLIFIILTILLPNTSKAKIKNMVITCSIVFIFNIVRITSVLILYQNFGYNILNINIFHDIFGSFVIFIMVFTNVIIFIFRTPEAMKMVEKLVDNIEFQFYKLRRMFHD